MMNKPIMIIVAVVVLAGSAFGCCTLPRLPSIRIPEIEINVPELEVGELREQQEVVPLGGADRAEVEVVFGAGVLNIEQGSPDELLSGAFSYNVAEWQPQITRTDDRLEVRQGGTRDNWGIPTGRVGTIRNEWALALSPAVPLDLDIKAGAGQGTLDLSGLQLTSLAMTMGAGDFEILFDDPNPAELARLTLDTGASSLEITGLGNAAPRYLKVQGGAGDLTLDFSGAWPESATIDIAAGVGSLTLRLPAGIGVEVETRGAVAPVEAEGFEKSGNTYVNGAFGEAEIDLRIEVTLGVGEIRLIEIAD